MSTPVHPRLPNITYGNVVATLALFIALGGVSWAAVKLPKNSVGSKQIKKNAVTSAKIKNRTITGSDVKNSTITGKQVNESSLGTVPSATSAASAESWTRAVGPTFKRVAPSADNASAATAQAAAAEVPLAAYGTVDVYGKCFTSGGNLFGYAFARTSQNGALLNSSVAPGYFGTPAFLDTTTAEASRVIMPVTAGSGSAAGLPPAFIGTNVLIGPDGKGLDFRITSMVKNGDLIFGNGPYGVGQACLFTLSGEKLDLG